MLQEKLIGFQPEVDGESLLNLARGYQDSLLMYQSFKAGVFEALDGCQKSAEAVARSIGGICERIVFLLNALVALGLVEKNDDLYSNSQVAQTFLVSRSQYFQGDLLELQLAPGRCRCWEKLSDWLKGESEGMAPMNKPEQVFNPAFVKAMAQGTLSRKGFDQVISLIANHHHFQTARRLLDLGGGHGLYAMALKQIKPELDAAVFDLPHVQQVTEVYSRRYSTELNFIPGDFYTDELPGEQDIILAFDVLYLAPSEKRDAVLQKIRQSLSPGGHLFLKQWFLNVDRSSPKLAAIFALSMRLGNSASFVCTLQEAEEMLRNTGFQIEGSSTIGDSVSTLLIARKGERR